MKNLCCLSSRPGRVKPAPRPHYLHLTPPLRMSILQEDFFNIFHRDCFGGIWAMPYTEGPKSNLFLM